MDLAEKVAAALQASVLPSVIARGGELRVLAVENGVAVLEVGGSPGASLPLIARIEALIRSAVPEVVCAASAVAGLAGLSFWLGGDKQHTQAAGKTVCLIGATAALTSAVAIVLR